jgi:hypothetical protein
MTPDQKLAKVFELSEFSKELLIQGLRDRFPNATPDELRKVWLERLEKCHNRNY